MDSTDWDSVMQFVSDPLELDFPDKQSSVHSSLLLGGLQIPTPPQSHDGSPVLEEDEAENLVSVSTTFHLGALHGGLVADVVLLTTDSVFFYVHSAVLLRASKNEFNSILRALSIGEQRPILNVQEASAILNIILHAIYDLSVAHFSPSFDDMVSAINRLPLYGIPPKSCITSSNPTFNVLLSQAPLYPLELYALAASFDLYDLAAATSPHLLSLSLASLTDEIVERMGAVYLKRLFFLHFGRSDALKRVLLSPPHPHPPTSRCDFAEQKKLTRAWALASAYLAWDARPDLSTSTMESALRPLAEHLSCDLCQESLENRIKSLVVQWSVVKRTI